MARDSRKDTRAGGHGRDDLKSSVDRASDLARQIWLAGVGAYGQAIGETQEQVSKQVARVGEEASRVFDELVSRGSDLESTLGTLRSVGSAGAEQLRRSADPSLSLEERLNRMRNMLGLSAPSADLESKVDGLVRDVAALNAKLDLLLKQTASKEARSSASGKPRAKKAAPKKKTAPKAKGQAKKKATARKAAAGKSGK